MSAATQKRIAPDRPERAGTPKLHLFLCPGCGGSFGRGKGPHGLARHECPSGQLTTAREQLAVALALVAELEQQQESLRTRLQERIDGALASNKHCRVCEREHASELTAAGASSAPLRTPPPTTAPGTTLRFAIGVEHGYLTVCERDDGSPCAIFVCLAKHGDELRGALDAWSRLFSVAMQYGVPLADLCGKFKHQRFEPNGWTDVEGIGFATSIPDLVVRWLERRYLGSAVAGHVAATNAGQQQG